MLLMLLFDLVRGKASDQGPDDRAQATTGHLVPDIATAGCADQICAQSSLDRVS